MKRYPEETVGVINFPIENAGIIPLSNLVKILDSLYGRLVLITGNEGSTRFKDEKGVVLHSVSHRNGKGLLGRMLNYILTQFRISWIVLKDADRVGKWIFFIGGEGLLLPIVAAKLRRKKVILGLVGYVPDQLAQRNDRSYRAFDLLMRVNLALADSIVLYSPNLIKQWRFERWSKKIHIAHEHFVDFSAFSITRPFKEREKVVGYVGRLTVEKGILELARAIPAVVEQEHTARFIIGGDGVSKQGVQDIIAENGLDGLAHLAGWVPHDQLPEFMNRLRLLVLPSATEGLPNVVLEALSCGTPVLVTPVGSLPGVLTDSETGYLLAGGSPEDIAEGVVRALRDERGAAVAEKGHDMVRKEFTFENAQKLWAVALGSTSSKMNH